MLNTKATGDVLTAAEYNAIVGGVNQLDMPWLVVDGIYIREGSGGPIYKTVGYNCYVAKAAGGSTAQTLNAAQREEFFSGLRPNSLTRVWAFAPVGGTFTWAQVLAELDAIVTSARKNGQRLIMCLTGMGVAANDAYGGKAAAWFTSRTWRTSVSGATSLQAWTETVVARYKSEPCVPIYDLINEPSDTGGAFTADLVLYAQEMAGYVKGQNPNALVYSGTQFAAALGGTAQFQQFSAVMDFCAAHNYDSTGYLAAQSSVPSVAATLGKPMIVDEVGVWAKGVYGTTADTDKDTNGLPAADFRAQARLTESFIQSALAVPGCFGVLYWSYMDTDASWYTGTGMYEPLKQSDTTRVLAETPLNQLGRLASNQLAGITNWIDAVFSLRYPPGTQIGGPNSGTTALNLIYDRTSQNYRQATQANAPWAAQDVAGWPTLRFNGAQWFTTSASAGPGAHSVFAVVAPTALPGSGTFAYLCAPSTSANGFAVRLTSAGVIQLVNYGSGTPVVIGTGTTVLPTDGRLSFIEVRWDAAGGGWRIRVNGVSDANGTTVVTLGASSFNVGAGPSGVSGWVGHIAELFKFNANASAADQARVYAYLDRKYRLPAGAR